MNSLFATPPVPPHFYEHTCLSPTRSMSSSTPSQSRKRKASPSDDQDDLMSSSPPRSPANTTSNLPRPIKKVRPNLSGRSLSLPRLLETLDTDSLRSVLSTICSRHPEIEHEVTQLAPRPSVSSTLDVLHQYQQKLRAAFPFGGNPASEYAYNRVRPALNALLEALSDFTPQFLPPTQPQASTSLSYLDGVTQIIHELPDWDRASNSMAKENAYEEISRAWAMVFREAGKRGAGMSVLNGGWDEKVRRHHEQSGGKMGEAIEELRTSIGWVSNQDGSGLSTSGNSSSGQSTVSDRELVRQQLFSGTYGAPGGIRTGFW